MKNNLKAVTLRQVTVIGAGVIGVTTAWFLNQAGFNVRLIDANPAAAMGTSKANGGQLSVSHAEPWARPELFSELPRLLWGHGQPLKILPRFDPSQYKWLLAFLRECSASRHEHNIRTLIALGFESRAAMQKLESRACLDYARRDQGIAHIYTSEEEFARAERALSLMIDAGLGRTLLTREQLIEIDPSLGQIPKLRGGTFTQDDSSGDAHLFTTGLLKELKPQIELMLGTKVSRLMVNQGQVIGFHTYSDVGSEKEVQLRPHEQLVLACGELTPKLTKPVGIDPMIYPVKGYSATFEVLRAQLAPQTSLIDDEYKLVFSRFTTSSSDVLRVAGMAEVGASSEFDHARAKLITERVKMLFPAALDLDDPEYWQGFRPCTPSNIPVVGPTAVGRLWLNAGHGTLGWTLAAGSAARLTRAMLQNT